MDGPRHQRQILEVVAAVGNAGGNGVVTALVGKRGVVERLEDDLHLLLEELAIARLIAKRRPEGLDLARVVAAADAEGDATARQRVDHREILGQPQRMPHRRDVEAAAEPEPVRLVCEVERHHQDVRDALVPLALEVVLGEPERIVPRAVEQAGERSASSRGPSPGARSDRCGC
jgi:hypothetical protein